MNLLKGFLHSCICKSVHMCIALKIGWMPEKLLILPELNFLIQWSQFNAMPQKLYLWTYYENFLNSREEKTWVVSIGRTTSPQHLCLQEEEHPLWATHFLFWTAFIQFWVSWGTYANEERNCSFQVEDHPFYLPVWLSLPLHLCLEQLNMMH